MFISEKPELQFHVDMFGISEMEEFLEEFIKYVDNPKEVFEKILDDFVETVKKIFEHEGAWEGLEAWKKLSKYTQRIKKVRFPGKGMLVATEDMYKSLTDRFSPLMETKITKSELVIKSKREDKKGKNLVQKHREGFKEKITWGEGGMFSKVVNVPARDPAPISDKHRERIVKTIIDSMNEKMQEEIKKRFKFDSGDRKPSSGYTSEK